MTMKGEPVPPEGLDHIKALQKWLEQYPNDVMVRSKLADLQRDPRFTEPDDIMPQVPHQPLSWCGIKQMEACMDDKTIVTLIGLLFDIAGVAALFYSTSRKKIEAEISFDLVRSVTPKENEEWGMSITREEHWRSLLSLEQRIKRNRRLQRVALASIIFGFVLQAVGLFV